MTQIRFHAAEVQSRRKIGKWHPTMPSKQRNLYWACYKAQRNPIPEIPPFHASPEGFPFVTPRTRDVAVAAAHTLISEYAKHVANPMKGSGLEMGKGGLRFGFKRPEGGFLNYYWP